MIKMNAQELRTSLSLKNEKLKSKLKRSEIYIILDNVLDTYNIGSIFRLSDGVGAKKIYLCGATATPPNPRIKKASINTSEIVEWEYSDNAVNVIRNLKSQIKNLQIVAIEQAQNSLSYDSFNYQLPIALVVGHESFGVSKEVLEVCDGVVEIPMYGVNISLNVMVALAIVLYQVLAKVKIDSKIN